jgi:hypothetical protein
LQGTPPAVPPSPNQFRPTTIGGAQKSHSIRRKGLTTKFQRGDSLQQFEHAISAHLIDNGLDTVAYVPDSIDSSKMSFIVTDHSRFSTESTADAIAPQLKAYDSYDLANDTTATVFFLDSLHPDLAQEVRDVGTSTDSFPLVFMQLIKLIRSVSIERFEQLKESIKKRHPSQYGGQDLSALATDFRKDARELVIAGQYDHNLTLRMLDAFLEGGGKGNEDFRYPLRAIKKELNAKLLIIGHMTPSAATTLMASSGLTYRHVCEQAVNEYRTQLDNKRWPPASHAPDVKAPPKAFGNVAAAAPITMEHIYALMQQQDGKSFEKKGNCHKCGKPGHWSRECPSTSSQGNRTPGARRGQRDKIHQSSSPYAWKKTAPKTGESEKKDKDGRTWFWCGKCGRWSTTHGTTDHKGKQGDDAPASASHVNTLRMQGPAAWCVEITKPVPEHPNLWSLFLSLLAPYAPVVLPMLLGSALTAFDYNRALPLVSTIVLPRLAIGLQFFSEQWQNLLPSMLWLGVLYQATRPPQRAILQRSPDPISSPVPQPRLRSGPKWNKKQRRAFRRLLARSAKSPARSIPSPVAMGRHRRGHQPPNRTLDDAYALVDLISDFARKLQACTVRLPRTVEGGTQRKPVKWGRSPPGGTTYRPKVDSKRPVLTTRQLDDIATCGRAYANVAMADLPTHLATVARTLLTGSVPPTPSDKHNVKPVIWDSGASYAVSPDKGDFVGPLKTSGITTRLKGLAKGLLIAGEGFVAWSFVDIRGQLRTIKVPAYYVPKSPIRLLGTQSLLNCYQDEHIRIEDGGMVLSGSPTDPSRHPIHIPIDNTNNLPIAYAREYGNPSLETPTGAFLTPVEAVSLSNRNLSEGEKELLRWHQRLGHLSFRKIQFLMRTGVLAHSEGARRLQASAAKLKHSPMCSACQYGKQRLRPSPGRTSHVVKDRVDALRTDDLFPGQRVSVDHFICHAKGRLLNTFGKEEPEKKYSGGCIFVDHATGYTWVALQSHLNTHETLKAKELYELHCRDYGVIPHSYHSDNGTPFTSAQFAINLHRFSQTHTYAGTGAHHHNGIAERSIQTIMSIARTMMIHAAVHWPAVADTQLWPLAVLHALELFNHVPDPTTGISAQDLFSRTRWPHSKFKDIHVWGCPVYVLEKTISDGKSLPRWKPRSTRGVYVGMSQQHASTVPLVLNLDTGAITPKFHIVFDDWFATVGTEPAQIPDFATDAWNKLFGDSVYQYVFDETEGDASPAFDSEDLSAGHNDLYAHRDNAVRTATDQHTPAAPLPMAPPPETPPAIPTNDVPSRINHTTPAIDNSRQQRERDQSHLPVPVPPMTHQVSPATALNPPASSTSSAPPLPTPRSSPTAEAPVVYPTPQREKSPAKTQQPTPKKLQLHEPRRSTRRNLGQAAPRLEPSVYLATPNDVPHGSHFQSLYHGFNIPYPWVAKASVSDPDIYNWTEAMRSPYMKEFRTAADAEIDSLVAQRTWDEVTTDDALEKILPGTWVFRIKRTPDGTIKKFKARYCCRGDLQEGTFDTFAPVVAWSTVRLFLVIAVTMGWITVSIDFSSAFVQASLKEPVWIHVPQGYGSTTGSGVCLRLRKSIYGIKTAPKLWYEMLMDTLTSSAFGFTPSQGDPCLLFAKDVMIIVYVDDVGIAAPTEEAADAFIQRLREHGYQLTKEGTFTEFLGIKFDKQSNGSIELTQKGLIDKIIKATGLEDSNPNWLPHSQTSLGTDPDGLPMNEDWAYPSIIGMLLYLSTNTRPDISFAVSQAGRFAANPKQSHAKAVKTIVRYLKRTYDKGTIILPNGKLDLKLYVDADFAGLHGSEPDTDPNCVRSRTGYIILLGSCPLLWKSVLQSWLSASTLEAEYSALSYALKTLIPIKRLLHEAARAMRLPTAITTSINAQVFEDNQGALFLATNQRITNRTKYFLIKWHWFWANVNSDDPELKIEIVRVESLNQLADYFTKGLSRELFEHNRRGVQGW